MRSNQKLLNNDKNYLGVYSKNILNMFSQKTLSITVKNAPLGITTISITIKVATFSIQTHSITLNNETLGITKLTITVKESNIWYNGIQHKDTWHNSKKSALSISALSITIKNATLLIMMLSITVKNATFGITTLSITLQCDIPYKDTQH